MTALRMECVRVNGWMLLAFDFVYWNNHGTRTIARPNMSDVCCSRMVQASAVFAVHHCSGFVSDVPLLRWKEISVFSLEM